MRSLRVELGVRLLAGLGLTVLAVGSASWLLVREAVSRDFDAALAAKAWALGKLVSVDEDGFDLHLGEDSAAEYIGGADAEYMEIREHGGAVVARSPSLGTSELPPQFAGLGEPVFWDLPLADGRPGRAVGLLIEAGSDDGELPAGLDGPPRFVIATARSRERLDDTLSGVALISAAGCVVTLLVIVLMVRSSVRRALAPVKVLSERLDAIDAGTLSRRVPLTGLPEELGFIPPKLNALLERLEQAFERERRMTGNIAHELRTPLAELRTATDIARRWPDDEALRAEAVATGHTVALRMGGLVDALLKLSRIASGHAHPERDEIPVAAAVAQLWSRVAESARQNGQDLQLEIREGLVLRTDRRLLDVAFGNLLGNAVRHGARGQPIRCDASPHDGSLRLTVANGASSLRAEDLPRLTEPFWMKDGARSDATGVGLGLAMVDAVADALGGHLSFELAEGCFQAHLDLPEGGVILP